jgi:DNA-3-methyladenine glycosylase I
MKRCDWVDGDGPCVDYHDKDWGVPVHDDRRLFEMLILEGTQAGLSWITILKRREAYRKAYDGFDPVKMSRWSKAKIERLLNNPGIIRNRLKVEAAKTNAGAFLRLLRSSVPLMTLSGPL